MEWKYGGRCKDDEEMGWGKRDVTAMQVDETAAAGVNATVVEMTMSGVAEEEVETLASFAQTFTA